MTSDTLALLEVALRTRASTIEELAAESGLDPVVVHHELERLADLGLVRLTGHSIVHVTPEESVITAASAALQASTEYVESTLRTAGDLIAALPRLLHAWEEGHCGDHTLEVSISPGPAETPARWPTPDDATLPRSLDICFPDASHWLRAGQGEHAIGASAATARQMSGGRVRALVSVSDAIDAAFRPILLEELRHGTLLRMHSTLPSYFWVRDEHVLGLPAHWGQLSPTRVLELRSKALAESVQCLFDRLWREATPLTLLHKAPWEHMLRKLESGATMDAASAALGITPRTGRRRVTEAMGVFGVSSQFALGYAWGRSDVVRATLRGTDSTTGGAKDRTPHPGSPR